MICPKCEEKNLEPTATKTKDEYNYSYCTCPACGYKFIVRKKITPYSETEIH